jgi:hypothetical protein
MAASYSIGLETVTLARPILLSLAFFALALISLALASSKRRLVQVVAGLAILTHALALCASLLATSISTPQTLPITSERGTNPGSDRLEASLLSHGSRTALSLVALPAGRPIAASRKSLANNAPAFSYKTADVQLRSLQKMERKAVAATDSSELWAIVERSGEAYLAQVPKSAIVLYDSLGNELAPLEGWGQISFLDPVHINGVEVVKNQILYLFFDGRIGSISWGTSPSAAVEIHDLGDSLDIHSGWQSLDIVRDWAQLKAWKSFNLINHNTIIHDDVLIAANSTTNRVYAIGLYKQGVQVLGHFEMADTSDVSGHMAYREGAFLIDHDRRQAMCIADAWNGSVLSIDSVGVKSESSPAVVVHKDRDGKWMGPAYLEGGVSKSGMAIIGDRQGGLWQYDVSRNTLRPRLQLRGIAHAQDLALTAAGELVVGERASLHVFRPEILSWWAPIIMRLDALHLWIAISVFVIDLVLLVVESGSVFWQGVCNVILLAQRMLGWLSARMGNPA